MNAQTIEPQKLNVSFTPENNQIINVLEKKVAAPCCPRNKCHCKMPKTSVFIGEFNRETKQLEGEIIPISAVEKTGRKIERIKNYIGKRLELERIHNILALDIAKVRDKWDYLETF